MKQMICMMSAVALVLCMTASAAAVTPSLDVPDMPEIPDLSDDVQIELPGSFWDRWFIRIDWSRMFGEGFPGVS